MTLLQANSTISTYYFACILIAICIIGFIILITTSRRHRDINLNNALGLPIGSVRAILSITLLVLFVTSALIFYLTADDANKSHLAEQIITILGTLLIAVISFYFGVKATEQGGRMTQEAINKSNYNDFSQSHIPLSIIYQAITRNKEQWIQDYDCKSISLGKKISNNKQFDLDCITLSVTKKTTPSNTSKVIPALLSYKVNGVSYDIPTDVIELDEVKNANTNFEALSLSEQRILLKKAKNQLSLEWSKTIDNLQSVSIDSKNSNGADLGYLALRFQVNTKKGQEEIIHEVPKYIEFVEDGKLYQLPTDVEEVGQTYADSYNNYHDGVVIQHSSFQPGCSIGRKTDSNSTSSTGTLGLKVKKVDSVESDPTYILSCYHVLCSKELKEGIREVDSINAAAKITAPGVADNGKRVIAIVTEGILNSFMDVALAVVEPTVNVQNSVYRIGDAPNGILNLTEEHENQNLSLSFIGRTSNLQFGKVMNKDAFATIDYGHGKLNHTIHHLIMTTKISKPGDSGGCAYDHRGNLVGMVVSSNDKYSYLIPINRILNQLNIIPCLV